MTTSASKDFEKGLATRKQVMGEAFVNKADLLRHLGGGCLMGVGAVLAMGCSIGQGLSGMSTFSLASLLACLGMLLGAYAALWRDLQQA